MAAGAGAACSTGAAVAAASAGGGAGRRPVRLAAGLGSAGVAAACAGGGAAASGSAGRCRHRHRRRTRFGGLGGGGGVVARLHRVHQRLRIVDRHEDLVRVHRRDADDLAVDLHGLLVVALEHAAGIELGPHLLDRILHVGEPLGHRVAHRLHPVEMLVHALEHGRESEQPAHRRVPVRVRRLGRVLGVIVQEPCRLDHVERHHARLQDRCQQRIREQRDRRHERVQVRRIRFVRAILGRCGTVHPRQGQEQREQQCHPPRNHGACLRHLGAPLAPSSRPFRHPWKGQLADGKPGQGRESAAFLGGRDRHHSAECLALYRGQPCRRTN